MPPGPHRADGRGRQLLAGQRPQPGPRRRLRPVQRDLLPRPTAATVEIWNLVFTQFNRVGDPPDNLRPLPSKNIDTGMGLERTAAVLQGVETNFHIDILRRSSRRPARSAASSTSPTRENGRRLRRIADHVRACTFAIHENVYPGRKKEKYVIRRLLRRAVLDGHQMGLREPFLHKLVPAVAELMKTPYPELAETDAARRRRDREGRGQLPGHDRRRPGPHRADLRRDEEGAIATTVAGAEAADMYQTYGFPPELFETLAAERNLAFDWDGYREAMESTAIRRGGAADRDGRSRPARRAQEGPARHAVPRLRNDRGGSAK